VINISVAFKDRIRDQISSFKVKNILVTKSVALEINLETEI
jgi:hypothetical protein